MSKTSIIKFQNVYKSYQTQSVLDHIDLDIHEGEFFGLVGVNGAGKTTLMKILLDFCDVSTGQIEILNTHHTRPHSRVQLAFLPEQFIPPYFLSGYQFLKYMANLHGHTHCEADIDNICHVLNLPRHVLKQSVRDYSKGMAQKLGLAACFLSNKKILILDEPMSGLDPKARAYIKRYLMSLKPKITLFFSTHLLADVEALCDRMAILHEGSLKFIGTPSECCQTFETNDLEQAYLRCIGE